MNATDPRVDPDVRWRVERALTQLLRAARTVAARRTDGEGWVDLPEPIGDITGVLAYADTHIVGELERALAVYGQVAGEVRTAVDVYQRQTHGEHWRGAA